MIDEKRAWQKLEELAIIFQSHMKAKRYQQAKNTYDKARAVAVFNEIEEEKQDLLFGKMKGKGEIEQEGLFKIMEVQKAYFECCVIEKELTHDCLLCREHLMQKK